MKKIFVVGGALAVALQLTACSSNPTVGKTQASTPLPSSVNALADVKNILIVDVPSAGNAISDGMMLASIKSGTKTNAVQSVTSLLNRPNAQVGIAGKKSSINLATAEKAISNANPNSTATLYIQATPEQLTSLQSIATPKGITVKVY